MGTTPTQETGPEGIPLVDYKRRWATLWILNLSLVLVVMGNSAVNVAIPTWQKTLGASTTEIQWIVDGYALAFGGLLLTMGALGDRFGRRGALQIGLGIFGLASLWAALFATSPMDLIISRSLMGVGAALVMPATLSILTTVFPRDERGKAIGIWAAFAGIGGVIGLLSSGALLEVFDWPSIFWLNVIVVAAAIGLGMMFVPTSKESTKAPIDVVGSMLSIVALGSLLYAIIEGPVEGWDSALIMGAIAIGLVTMVAFILWERRTPHPMLPMSFFKERGFNAGVVVISLVFFAMFSMFFLLTQYLQGVQGHGTFAAAIRFIPLTFGMILAAPNSDKLVRKFSARAVVGVGLTIVALGLTSMAFFDIDTPFWRIGLTELFLGIGMGFSMAPATTIIMESIPKDKAGVGSSMNDTAREVGGAFGIAILGSILKEVYQTNLADALPPGIPDGAREGILSGIGGAARVTEVMGGAQGTALFASAQQAFVDALLPSFLTAGIMVALAAIIVTVFFPRNAQLAHRPTTGDTPASASDPQANAAPARPRVPTPAATAASAFPATSPLAASAPRSETAMQPRPSGPIRIEARGGWLVAHEANTDKPAWHRDLEGATPLHMGDHAPSSDTVFGALRDPTGYHAIALGRHDGKELWRQPLPSAPAGAPRLGPRGIVWNLLDGTGKTPSRVTLALHDGRVRGRVTVRPAVQ